jgi:3-phosphoshikimate 1-carboxyvinyltransferase
MDAAFSSRAGLRATPGHALRGEIAVPGDKSMSHRALILAALARGESRIDGLLESDDVLRTLDAVRAFGAEVERTGTSSWKVTGSEWRSPGRPIDCGNSGTGARLLIGAAARFALTATFTGDESLRRRPMDRVTDPLTAMGASFDSRPHLPLTVRGGRLRGIRHSSPTPSAQVKSAILLAGLGTSEPVEVVEPIPSRDHTEQMLRHFGCDVETGVGDGGHRVRLGTRRTLHGSEVQIPGDPSSAAFPIVAALIVPGSEISMKGILDSPTRAGLLTTLREMGADIRIENPRNAGGCAVMDLTVRSSALRGVTVPKERAPAMIDEYPVLAVAAAFAAGDTVMEGLGELRVKESDRLAAIRGGLASCGVESRIVGDSLSVAGSIGRPPPGGALIRSERDHRIAMAFLTLGLASERPVAIDDATRISTSFPGFADAMGLIGARISAADFASD